MKSKEEILIEALEKIISLYPKNEDWAIRSANDIREVATKAIADYNGASQFPSQGLRWVKASERLPELNKTVHIKTNALGKNIGHWDGEDFWPHYDWQDCDNGLSFEIVEWLDEGKAE